MSRKRHNTSSPEPDYDSPPPKRRRPSWVDEFDAFEHPTAGEVPQTNAFTGQKSAFPGLDEVEGELLYGDPEDGIQYLRMVRSEARQVPPVLVVPKEASVQTIEDEDEMYEEDYHADKAYVAAPMNAPQDFSGCPPDAQDLYHLCLIERFTQMQAALRTQPPLDAMQKLKSSQPISFPSNSRPAQQKWRYHVHNAEPNTTQIACMDAESVLELVKLLTESLGGTIRSRSSARIKRLGGWIWAALAKCRDCGELSSEEVAEVREMGKRAVHLLETERRWEKEVVEEERLEQEENPVIVEDGSRSSARSLGAEEDTPVEGEKEAAELEKARARVSCILVGGDGEILDETAAASRADSALDQLKDSDTQIRMMLDMVITIGGECYGQRDLLESRDIW